MEFYKRVDPSKAYILRSGLTFRLNSRQRCVAVWLGGGGMNMCSINIKLIDYITVWNFTREWIPEKRTS